ncbi:MAG: ClbS/DfsB family four-helix bundle protein [Chloroflexota bacterium]
MSMKEHILAALREQFNRWQELLSGLKDEQIMAPQTFGNWSVKDVVAHLWAWQQRSIARLEAALADKEPVFPHWQPDIDVDDIGSTDQINAWIYNAYREQAWESVYQNWRDGYLRLLLLAEQISERHLLDSSRYAWLEGYSLALILLATYDHHQEHLEKLTEVTDMINGDHSNRSMPDSTVIPVLAYPDVRQAVDWLCQAFGFAERLRIGDHRAQLSLGGGSVIVTGRQPGPRGPAGSSDHSIMVRVADVDSHYRHAAQFNAQIVNPPADQAYGERQYTVKDPGGHYWTFSQTIADVDPESWGGQLVNDNES